MKITRRLLRPLALLAALGLLAACGSDDSSEDTTPTTAGGDSAAPADEDVSPEWQAVIDAAKAEGSVVWYHVNFPAEVEPVAKAFEEKYGIKVELNRVLAEAKATLESEMTTGTKGADIVTVADRSIAPLLRDAGGLVPLTDLPNFELWADSDSLVSEDTFISNYVLKGLAWNTDLVPDPPETYEDLLDPAYSNGKIGVPVAKPGGAAAFWLFLEKHLGEDYVEALAAQKPRFYETGAPLDQALAAGEVAVGVYSGPTILEEKEAGAPIDYLQVKPSIGFPIDSFMVEWAEHPNAAKLLINFLLSPEGQETLASVSAPGLAGVDGYVTTNDIDAMEEKTYDDFEAYVSKWNQIFER